MRKTTWIAACAAVLGAAAGLKSVAWADVTLEHRIAVSGVGIMSAGNLSGTTKTTISGLPMLTQIRFRVSVTESKTEALGLALEWSNDVPFTLV